MVLSKKEVFVLSCLFDYINFKQEKCSLNIDGIKLLAKINSKIGAELLGVNAKDIYKNCEESLLKTINYTK
jgi:hypothetical protein|tara:strand:+ start:190 stop:402 length:213 start_codon:yes stop_codon:yes gene_type:complete